MTKIIDFTQLKRRKTYEFWHEVHLEFKYKFSKYQFDDIKGHAICNVIEFIDYIINCNYRDFAFPDESLSTLQKKILTLKKQENFIKLSYDSSKSHLDDICDKLLISRIEYELKYIFQKKYYDEELKEEESSSVEERCDCALIEQRHLYRINRLKKFKNKTAKVLYTMSD